MLSATAPRVWSLLTNWERQGDWMPDVAWIRVLGTEREAGARLAVRTRVFGVPAATDLVTVTGWEPPRRLSVAHTGIVQGEGDWLLEPIPGQPDSTVFTWTERITMRPAVLGELAIRLYGPWQRRMLRASLANLRRLVSA